MCRHVLVHCVTCESKVHGLRFHCCVQPLRLMKKHTIKDEKYSLQWRRLAQLSSNRHTQPAGHAYIIRTKWRRRRTLVPLITKCHEKYASSREQHRTQQKNATCSARLALYLRASTARRCSRSTQTELYDHNDGHTHLRMCQISHS